MATAPTPKYFEIVSAGNDDIRNLTKQGHNFGGPVAIDETQWDFGQALGGEWSVRRFVFGWEGMTTDNQFFWLSDYISDVTNNNTTTVDAQNFFSGIGNWSLRMRVSKSFITGFTNNDILASPWVDVTYGATPVNPNDLKQLILNQTSLSANTGGNNNGPDIIVPSLNYSNLWLTNTYIYVAIRPDVSALPGLHTNWGFRQKFVYP